jgi:hypothetical protein
METKKYRIFRKAYNALKDCTPLNSDCGILCNKACCKGGDEKGMLLFPGEEEFLENNKYLNIRKTNIVFNNGYNVCFATCSGKCDRSQRPLSCMIFPLTPVIRDGRIYMEIDLRGIETCPLVNEPMKYMLDKKFIEKVYSTINILQKLENSYEFLEILTKTQKSFKLLDKQQ